MEEMIDPIFAVLGLSEEPPVSRGQSSWGSCPSWHKLMSKGPLNEAQFGHAHLGLYASGYGALHCDFSQMPWHLGGPQLETVPTLPVAALPEWPEEGTTLEVHPAVLSSSLVLGPMPQEVSDEVVVSPERRGRSGDAVKAVRRPTTAAPPEADALALDGQRSLFGTSWAEPLVLSELPASGSLPQASPETRRSKAFPGCEGLHMPPCRETPSQIGGPTRR